MHEDSRPIQESAIVQPEAKANPNGTARMEEPQFGFVDLVEAFTALRHEYRGQTRESRELAKSIQQVADQLTQFEHQQLERVPTAFAPYTHSDSPDTLRRFVHTLIEIDLILTRAVDAIEFAEQAEAGASDESSVIDGLSAMRAELTEAYENQGWLARFFGYRYWEQVIERIDAEITLGSAPDQTAPRQFSQHQATQSQSTQSQSTFEGLRMVVTRVRRLLTEHEIERIDTIGLMFDGELMNAVEAVDCSQESFIGKTISRGEVVRQHCPLYRWQGKLIRYAEVSVAQ